VAEDKAEEIGVVEVGVKGRKRGGRVTHRLPLDFREVMFDVVFAEVA